MSPAIPLRILHTESSLNWGGQEYRTLEEVRWLRAHGHMAWIACDPESELMLRAGPEFCVPVKMSRALDWQAARAIRHFCRSRGVDVVHTHSSKDSWICYPLHVTSWPVVRSRQVTNLVRPSLDRSFIYRHGCAAVVASAECIREKLISHTGVAADRVHVIGEGTDIERFNPAVDGTRVRGEWRVSGDAVLFGLAAMIRPEKGHDVFISAAIELLKTHGEKVRFVLVGEGVGDRAYEREVRSRLTALFGSAEDGPVFMAGYRHDMPEVMAALDVLVIPSFAEAQSIVTPQAFATGRPVIASRVGGLPELVTDEKTGLLVESNNVPALVAAMTRMADDRAFRKSAGENARELARHALSFSAKMEQCLSFYEQMVEASARPLTAKRRRVKASEPKRASVRPRRSRRRVAAALTPVFAFALALMIFLRPTLHDVPVNALNVSEQIHSSSAEEGFYSDDYSEESNVDETVSPVLFATADERIIG
ncbi:MAG: glycosyltransferase family 4 protein [Nibricoccus sp.]